ncbi:hypothetical protein BpHYR1_024863 [Brachionus plicatilis]|uniref:Secreted protein n=1 Tax=Brachionus plicatilis TaxID=10195 RepID=A0A3M7PW56_BRAPC|nr:hypothetical protein BpHYR1_024863 [Brachionus plicatilis]
MVQMRKKIQKILFSSIFAFKLFAALSQASLNVDPFGMNFTFIIRLNFFIQCSTSFERSTLVLSNDIKDYMFAF